MRPHHFSPRIGFAILIFGIIFGTAHEVPAAESIWHGFRRSDFKFEARDCFLVQPGKALPGNPWIWRARFPGYHPELDVELVRRGFHLAYIDVGGMYGNEQAINLWDQFYEHMREKHDLGARPVLEAVSRGGLIAYRWAARNPDKVACIYAESPVCDFTSWPGGKGSGEGSAQDWKQLLAAYDLTEPAALEFAQNPIDVLEPLAAYGVPLMHLIHMDDVIVPPEENTLVLQERYKKLGGDMIVIRSSETKTRLHGHHFDIPDPTPYVEFMEKHGRITPGAHDYFALRGGLPNAAAKFSGGDSARVAFLGGSITHNPGWQNQVARYLEHRFRETDFEFINAGIPSMGSTPGAFRLRRDVLGHGKIDLLFVEAAVNDSTNSRTDDEILRGMEGIVAHARREDPATDIVMMHFVDPGKMEQYRKGEIPKVIQIHERVAEHYDVASINLALEVTERIDAREFTWADDFKDLHPSPFGQRLYFHSIRRCLDAAFARPHASESRTAIKPLDSFSYVSARLVDITNAERGDGWELVENWNPADGKGTRAGFVNVPMLVSTAPGSVLRFPFHGTAVGLFVAAGPDAGQIDYRVDAGDWKRLETYTQWSSGLHLPWLYVLEAELDATDHVLEIKVAEEHHPKSKGTAIRIAHFGVN